MRFEDTNLIPELLRAVADAGYETPTRIQEDTIPLALMGRDVLGCAQTGTGKTAAFALPILQRLYQKDRTLYGGRTAGNGASPAPSAKGKGKDREIRALILTPTRELALQIEENLEQYDRHLPLRSCVIFGGVSQVPQVEHLKKGVDVLVATPGRLNDLIGQGFIDLSHLEIFVLDEADRMLDMGFLPDVRRVMAKLPPVRQTLFFSATMPPEVEKLALELLYEPITIKVNPPTSTVDAIRQQVIFVDKVNKRKLLAQMLQEPEVVSALVFVRTKHGADRVARDLNRDGIKAASIHGDKSQGARQKALSDFKGGKLKALIATDIAARGIDISELSHVFNFDVPNEPETYIHRIGRTGRAGLGGDAITFCCYDELEEFRAVEKLIGKTVPETPSPYPMEVFTSTGNGAGGRPPRNASGNGKNKRNAGRERNDNVKKYGHDKAERRFPKEEWFDPDTEQVVEVVKEDASSADSAPSATQQPKKKRNRHRKKKHSQEGGGSASSAAEPAAKPAAKPTAKPVAKSAAKPAAKPTAKPADAPATKPADESPAAAPKSRAANKPQRKQNSSARRSSDEMPRQKPQKPAKQAAQPAAEPADDFFMPEIVFKKKENRPQDESPKKAAGALGILLPQEDAGTAPKPTDELNTELTDQEKRSWLGSRGQRPKVVDRRNSDD